MTIDPDDLPSAPKWQRLPGRLRLKLAHMIADHLRDPSAGSYAELRDRPEFLPWFGTHLGHRGEKRFDRMVKSVRRSQPQRVSRQPAVNAEGAQGPSAPSSEAPATSAAKQLAQGGAPSFEELQDGLRDRLSELAIGLAACTNDFGEIVDARTYKQLSTEYRATTLAIGQLSKQYHEALTAGPALEPMLELLLKAAGPLATPQLKAELSDLLKQSIGLHAIRRTS